MSHSQLSLFLLFCICNLADIVHLYSCNDSLKLYRIAILFLTIRVSYREVISRYAHDTALGVIY